MATDSVSAPAPRPGILEIDPYVGGESKAVANRALGRPIRLASNEGPFGPSPAATAAYAALGGEIHRYPDGSAHALRTAIGEAFGLDPALITCGAGSDELIALLTKAYAGPGDEVLYSRHGFMMYPISARAAGATPVTAPETNLRTDVDALLAAVTPRTKIVFVANPNNPTGALLPAEEIARLHAGLPPSVVLALDSAYAEYVEEPGYDAGERLVATASNVVMLRTFSKLYAMAGLRLGWAYGAPGIIDTLNRVRGPFNVGAAAQAAGVAALGDRAFVKRSLEHNRTWRDWTARALAALGLTVYARQANAPTAGNFLLVGFAPGAAEAARLFLRDEGILVRQMGGYGLPDCLRITIGTEEEMREVVDALARHLAA
jgi:histidinol-phosphate aminotransferase